MKVALVRGVRHTGAALLAWLLIAACAYSAAAGSPQETATPLPERDTFLRNTRETLRVGHAFPSDYTFVEHERQVEYDGQAHPRKRTDKVFEIYPSVEGSPSYRRLLSINGVAVPRKTIEQADEKHRKELVDWVHDRQRETPAERAKRRQDEERTRQEDERTIDEVFRVFDIRLVGRTTIRGRPAIELSLSARPGVKTTVKTLALLQKVKGRAWIDEQDYEVVRVEAQTIDTIRIALGLLVRVDRGTTASFERQKTADGAWLPLRATTHAIGRIALLKRLDTEVVTDFRDYRKFTVDTAVSFTLPKGGK